MCLDIFFKGFLYSECLNVIGGFEFYYDVCIFEVFILRKFDLVFIIVVVFGKEC